MLYADLTGPTDHYFSPVDPFDWCSDLEEVWEDTITLTDEHGEIVAEVKVEPSEDREPYDAAIRAAGYTEWAWK